MCVSRVIADQATEAIMAVKRSGHYNDALVEKGDTILCGVASGELPILTVAMNFLAFCRGNNMCHTELLHSSAVLTHPKNRGGLGLNPFNAHLNLARVHRVGLETQATRPGGRERAVPSPSSSEL